VARPVDHDRRDELLDEVVQYLSAHGLADVSLRPLASNLGVSVSTLTHHFGSRDDLIVAALRRSAAVQKGVEDRWLRRQPDLSLVELMRAWWRWVTASPEHLALVRLEIEAVALEATLPGLPRELRGEQIGCWRRSLETRLIAAGVDRDIAVVEASLAKAAFTGLVVDLLATGQKTRLSRAFDVSLERLDTVIAESTR
jgi:AcrR family transcriptional regulator